MTEKRIKLDAAAFLDSPQALRLTEPDTGELRRVIEAFLGACYDELGKAPHLLEGDDLEAALETLLPRRLKEDDPVAAQVPVILSAYLDHLEESKPVLHAFELRRALDASEGAFLAAVRSDATLRATRREQPFVHGAPKLGRNDPCSCGSGKKYKKCHGRGL